MQPNHHYFKISQNNPEKIVDLFYVFLKKTPRISEYVQNTSEIKEILITLKKLRENQESEEILQKYFRKLFDVLNNDSNCSEFGCFVNACDNTLDSVRNDFDTCRKIAELFVENRELNQIVSENWIQAILDSNSSRKKGASSEIKLLQMLVKLRFKNSKNWEDFEKSNKSVLQFSKKIDLNFVRQKLNLKIKTKKQNKNLDLIIKKNEKIFLCEAKHLNTSGGGQDKQMSELIEILSLAEKRENVFFISFLDGKYSNLLLNSPARKNTKRATQQKEIQKFLKSRPQNFWVNSAGFQALFADLG